MNSITTRKLDSGVPQGSVVGPMLFTAYVSPVGDVITSMGLKHPQYADDTQPYFAVRESNYKDDLNIIEKCTSSVQDWFLVNDLLLNLIHLSQKSLPSELPPSAALPSARARWQLLEHRCRSLTTSVRSAYKSIRIFRLMRKSMQFADHITITPELCDRSVTICRPILLRQWLVPSSMHVLTTVTRFFTTSQRENIQKLQKIQNNLARVVLKAPRLTSPEPMLASLHWLPVVYRIQYKFAFITFKALTTEQPTYLADLLHRRVAVRHTR